MAGTFSSQQPQPKQTIRRLFRALVLAASLALCVAEYAQQPKALKGASELTQDAAGPGAQQAQVPNRRVEPPPARTRGITDGVEALHIQGFYAHEALADISRKANVVIGFEGVRYETDGKLAFDFPGGTVADLLNMFTAQAPDYRWQDDGGIIHVFREGAHISLADVVMDYPGAKEKTRFEIWRDLHARPEYRAWMRSTQCGSADEFHAKNFVHLRNKPFLISIPPGSITVAQLLDQVAVKSGVNSWAILQAPAQAPERPCRIWVNMW